MNINLIGMPIYYGCDVVGADLAYNTLLKRDIKSKFINNKIITNNLIHVDNEIDKYNDDKKIKYIKPIMDANKILYKNTMDNLKNGLSILIGGDHSSVIGNIAAELDYYDNDVTVIWIDTHTDIHTDKTTPSGNVHGMPLSILMGLCDKRFDIGNNKLKSENLIYIGTNNFEKEEIETINNNNIRNYTYNEIMNRDINIVINEVINNIKTKYVHISFDFDCLDFNEFKAVNVAHTKEYLANKGFTINEAKMILVTLLENLNVSGIDLVEYNPLMDEEKDVEIVEDFLTIIDSNLR